VETNPKLDVVDKNNRYVTNYTQGADIRYVKSLQLASEGTTASSSFRAELDSHAILMPIPVFTVCGYHEQSGHQNAIPVVSAATVWYDPSSKKEYCLVFHEALWFGDKLTQSLLNPTQMRRNAMDEYTSLPQIVMTSDSTWEPRSHTHEEAEAMVSGSEYQPYIEYDPHNLDRYHRLLKALESKQYEDSGTDYPEFMDDDGIYKRLISQVVSAPDDVPGNGLSGHDHSAVYTQYNEIREISKLTSSERMNILTPETGRFTKCVYAW
jgi:hypothetical protein